MEFIDKVYRERDRLVAFLSVKYPSHLSKATDAEVGFNYTVCVHTPTGQMSWHIPDHEVDTLFAHLPLQETDWDGHTTDEKYRRLDALTKSGG